MDSRAINHNTANPPPGGCRVRFEVSRLRFPPLYPDRLVRTAAASSSSICSVVSQETQASVMLWP